MPLLITFRAARVALTVTLLCVIAACSREQQDWRSAEGADTIEAYGQFLERHPDSELATQARARLAQLSEDRDWQRAESADSAEGYRHFLAQHPSGKWAQEARIRLENFSLGPAPPKVPSMSAAATPALTASAAAAPAVAPPPAPPVATEIRPSAARASATRLAGSSPGGYGVQLGAFSSEAGATNEWHQLTTRFGSELHGLSPLVVSADTPAGHLFRLQAQVADEAHARAICESLRKRSQACVPVLPR